MSKDLIVERKLLKVERVIGEDTVRETVESEIKLPFKVQKVFDVHASINETETEVREGGVLVSGNIHKQLFVVDKGDLVRHIDEDVPFQIFVDIPGARKDYNVQVDVNILSVDADLSHYERIRQVVVLDVFVKVTKTEQVEVVIDVKGRDIYVEKELLKVDHVVGEQRIYHTLTPTATLPITAKKIFRIIPSVRDVSTEIKKDTVIVKGIIHKQVFLVDEGDLVRHAFEDIPFSKSIKIEGARPENDVFVRVRVTLDDFEMIKPPSKELRQTLVLDIFVKVTETLQLKIVVNVKGEGIKVEKKLLKVESVVSDVLLRETVKATAKLPIQAIKIFDIMGEIVDLKTEAMEDRIVIRGTLHKQIFFVDPGDLVRHTREDIPFRFVKEVPGARPSDNIHVRAKIIGDIVFKLLGEKRLEQTAIIEIFAKVTRSIQLEVVVDVKRIGPHPPRPPHPPKPPYPPEPYCPHKQKYIVKEGDTLFFIAKRFGVALDALIAANPQIKNPDLIFPGDVIYIPQGPPFPPGRKYTVQKGDTLFLIAKR
ncbi:MAG TPA: DUF3794 domain-containing protein, partial [Firmicutes bacterium]|nr:DUF3794 domain-containing protein [Bacillota bacterium]